jgi:drug/metabolite transporter (DMT)-like permease
MPVMPSRPALRTTALTVLAMLAFAGNSLLCRIALRDTTIDAASFTSLRLASGALALAALLLWRGRRQRPAQPLRPLAGQWRSAAALFAYAAGFSFAYLSLPAATGALLLFGTVQTTMIGWGLWRGERLRPLQWLGLLVAAVGLVLLLRPGLAMPSWGGALLMIAAGLAWAVYSLRGRGAGDATAVTAGNFIRAAPLAVALSLALWPQARWDAAGAWLALASGAVTSGLGYAIWYTALRGLSATRAAVVQLSVPALAAAGAAWLLGEPLTAQLLLASVALLGGVALVIVDRQLPQAANAVTRPK